MELVRGGVGVGGSAAVGVLCGVEEQRGSSDSLWFNFPWTGALSIHFPAESAAAYSLYSCNSKNNSLGLFEFQ